MIRKKNVYLINTFDYELYLKKSGTASRCMIEPTDLLIKAAEKFDHSYTFFVDVLYLERLRRSRFHSKDLIEIEKQLIRLVEKGHRIELHLHPSWMDAVEKQDEWIFNDFSRNRLHSLDDPQIGEAFQTGIELLEGIAGKSKTNYKVQAFRAGGWCLQPFERLKPFFKKHGLWIDSTVAPGFYRRGSDIQYYDFESAPEMPYYFFDNDPLVSGGDEFLEIPVSVADIEKRLDFRIVRKLENTFLSSSELKIMGDGVGMGIDNLYSTGMPEDIVNMSSRKTLTMLTIQSTRAFSNKYLIDSYVKASQSNVVTLLSHPKNLNRQSFKLLKLFKHNRYKFIDIVNCGESIKHKVQP